MEQYEICETCALHISISVQNFQISKRKTKVLKVQVRSLLKSLVFVWCFLLKILRKYLVNLSVYIHHILLKTLPKMLVCSKNDTSVERFCKQFLGSELFVETTKNLCYWECIRIPCDADTFHDGSTLFSISE